MNMLFSYTVHVKVETFASDVLEFSKTGTKKGATDAPDSTNGCRFDISSMSAVSDSNTKVFLYGYVPVKSYDTHLESGSLDVDESRFECSISTTGPRMGVLSYKGERLVEVNKKHKWMPVKTAGAVTWEGRAFDGLRFTDQGLKEWQDGILASIESLFRENGDEILDGYKLKNLNTTIEVFDISLEMGKDKLKIETESKMYMEIILST